MEDWQREHINNNLTNLIANTNCDTHLLAPLIQKKVLSYADIDILNSAKSDHARSFQFYGIVQTRSNNSYRVLITVLKSLRRSGAVSILEDCKPPQTLKPEKKQGTNRNSNIEDKFLSAVQNILTYTASEDKANILRICKKSNKVREKIYIALESFAERLFEERIKTMKRILDANVRNFKVFLRQIASVKDSSTNESSESLHEVYAESVQPWYENLKEELAPVIWTNLKCYLKAGMQECYLRSFREILGRFSKSSYEELEYNRQTTKGVARFLTFNVLKSEAIEIQSHSSMINNQINFVGVHDERVTTTEEIYTVNPIDKLSSPHIPSAVISTNNVLLRWIANIILTSGTNPFSALTREYKNKLKKSYLDGITMEVNNLSLNHSSFPINNLVRTHDHVSEKLFGKLSTDENDSLPCLVQAYLQRCFWKQILSSQRIFIMFDLIHEAVLGVDFGTNHLLVRWR